MSILDILAERDAERQEKKIILNAALSNCPANVRKMLSASFINIDAEGNPPTWMRQKTVEELSDYESILSEYIDKRDKRANKCCEYFNIVELLTQKTLARVFSNFLIREEQIYVNVLPPTGSIANLIAISAFTDIGDTILSMEMACGGHLSHGSLLHFIGNNYRVMTYGIDENGDLDYKRIEELLKNNNVKLLIAGASSYPRVIDWKKIREIIDNISPHTKFMADIAHTAGLIAGKVFPSPFGYADIVTMVGYKTFCGPRSAAIFTMNFHDSQLINRTAFPYFLGAPNAGQIAALGVSAYNALKPSFVRTMRETVRNAQIFENELVNYGLSTSFYGTQTHIVMLDLKDSGIHFTGEEAVNLLEDNNIMANKNMLPGDMDNASASGVRFGFTWTAQKRYSINQIKELANIVITILK